MLSQEPVTPGGDQLSEWGRTSGEPAAAVQTETLQRTAGGVWFGSQTSQKLMAAQDYLLQTCLCLGPPQPAPKAVRDVCVVASQLCQLLELACCVIAPVPVGRRKKGGMAAEVVVQCSSGPERNY